MFCIGDNVSPDGNQLKTSPISDSTSPCRLGDNATSLFARPADDHPVEQHAPSFTLPSRFVERQSERITANPVSRGRGMDRGP